MKILVVSLLRLGDLIQQQLLIKGLREKHPQAEIHLLLNRQFSNAEKVLSGKIDKFIYFDRETLQKGLGEASYNILWSYQSLNDLVDRLDETKYDVVYNFTHNKLSAYLIGALKVSKKTGLYQQDGQFQGLESKWLRYFNDRFSGTTTCMFNYVELLAKGLDIPIIENRALEPKAKKSKLVLFQCLTSDSKKNWPLGKFKALKVEIERSLVDYEVRILGAPFERETLASVFEEEDLLICDLVEARKHLLNAALLITGDTSIKHMAAQMGIPIVEIVLGSSDLAKTGAYSSSSVGIASSAACAPCSHSIPCGQKTHLCADDITVQKVFEQVWDSLSGQKKIFNETHKLFERAVWSLYLDNSADYLGNYETLQLMISMQENEKKKVLDMLEERTLALQSFYFKIENAIPAAEFLNGTTKLVSHDIAGLIMAVQDVLKSKLDEGAYFQVVTEALLSRYGSPKKFAQGIARALEQVKELLNIRTQCLSYLKSFSKEGDLYAKGIGQLPGCGFEEAGKGHSRGHEDAEL